LANTVHDSAAQGYAAAADCYERGRTGFPPEAVAWIRERLPTTSPVVVDVGAGTGKLTRTLVEFAAQVIAIEPVAAMRSVLAQAAPVAETRAGVAENLPLPDGSADAITVGNAFHWFDGPKAIREAHRVLRTNGMLIPLWNRRDVAHPHQATIQSLVDSLRSDEPSYFSGEWRRSFTDSLLFSGPLERSFRWEQEATPDIVVDRVASTSFVATLPDEPRREVLAAARTAVEDLGEHFRLPWVTDVFIFQRRPA